METRLNSGALEITRPVVQTIGSMWANNRYIDFPMSGDFRLAILAGRAGTLSEITRIYDVLYSCLLECELASWIQTRELDTAKLVRIPFLNQFISR